MDLNVKLQGLEHNFKKVRGCFIKFQAPTIFFINRIIFLKKKVGRINNLKTEGQSARSKN
jgi:hypothetical protein